MTLQPAGSLGRLVVVTDRRQAAEAGHDLLDVVAAAVDAGASTILLREKDLAPAERTALAAALVELLAPVGGALLVGSDGPLARAVGATGVHLAAADPAAEAFFDAQWLPSNHIGAKNAFGGSGERGDRLLVGRSCHSIAELRAARDERVDYATLSPIWATQSKPGYGPALGLDGLAGAVAAVPGPPVYALGGVGPGRAAACLAAGAAGVAAMGEIMRAADPGAAVRDLLAGLPTERSAG
jgi:thiamine-phosphate pyrophosphorylase